MGNLNSGRHPGDGPHTRRHLTPVKGSGIPSPVSDLPAEVLAAFNRLLKLTEGTSFSQDSIALEQCARLMVRSVALEAAFFANPGDAELHRVLLAVGRQLMTLLGKFGLTPKDRQSLLVPREEEPKDEFEQMLDGN